MASPESRLLRWIQDEEPEVVLTCASSTRKYPRSTTPVQVPGCIADIDFALVPEMLACGAPRVWIDVASCRCNASSTLPEKSGPLPENFSSNEGAAEQTESDGLSPTAEQPAGETVAERLEAWQGLLRGAVLEFEKEEPRFRPAEVIAYREAPVSRRALFGLSSDTSLPVDPTAAPNARLINALEVLGVDLAKLDECAPAATSKILEADGCVACGVCVTACPTNSLKLETSEGGRQMTRLVHDLQTCQAHGQCVDLCPYDALEFGDTPKWDQVVEGEVELAQFETQNCPKCGAIYPLDGAGLCPTCRRKDANPFGYWLPPGFERKKRG